MNRAAFLGAVPLVEAKGTRRGAWIGNSPGRVPQPHRFQSAFMGQLTWPVTGDISTTPTTGLDMLCYKCGINPPLLMQPAMASFNPSCVEVDASQCAEQQAAIDEAQAGGGGAFSGGGTPTAAAPSVIAALRVFEPEEMKGLEGASVQVFSVSPYDGSIAPLASGTTKANGRYTFVGPVARFPGPTGTMGSAPGNIRFVVTRGSAPYNFPELSIETRNQGEITMPSFLVACPTTLSTLVCEVARGQAMWMTVYAQQIAAWGDSPQGRTNAADWARSTVLNTLKPTASELTRYFHMTYSWWIGVLDIKPGEWPELTTNHHQTAQIFAKIPFPKWPGIETYFTRCAAGIPFAMAAGPNAENYNVANPKLYVSRFSSYFPRSSKLIERDMAVAYSDGIAAILNCIIHKIKQKTKEIERSAKAMSMISMGIVVAFSPFLIAAGPSGVAVMATEAYEFVQMQNEGTGIESYGVTAALAGAMLAVGNIDFVIAALEPVIGSALGDLDPIAAQAVQAAYPQIIEAASDAVLGPQGIGTGFESGGGAIGGAAVAMAIKMIAGIAKNYAANRIEEFGDAVVGAQTAAADVMALVEGQEAGPHFKPFIQWVVDALGLIDLFEQAIDDFLDEFLDAFEAGQAQGGDVAVVEEEDGGGLAIVPTNSEGTPTDTEGNPLPGGKAPKTPLKDYEKDAGPSDVTAIVGAGGVTALLMVAGGVL